MKRRRLLRTALAGGAVLAAGCVGDEPVPGEAPSDSPTGTESPDSDQDDSTSSGTDALDSTETEASPGTDESSPTEGSTGTDGATSSPSPADGEPKLTRRSFEVVSRGCGQGRNEADATADSLTVTVTGTIRGSNPCHSARLAGASLDGSGTSLRVDVETYVPESDGTQGCVQCVADIEYESRFEFEDGRPDEVVVSHDGERVATVALGG